MSERGERVRQRALMVVRHPYSEPEFMSYDDDPGECHASFGMVELREGEEIVASADYAALAQQLADVAYLEEWLRDVWARGISRDDDGLYAYDGTETEGPYLNVGPCATFSALGALLRQREVGR